MKNRFLITLTILLLSGNLMFAQPGHFDPEIRICYLNLDTLSGNKLLIQRYQADDPEYIRITGYRDFLHTLLYQSKSNYTRYFSRSDQWLQKLKKNKTADGSIKPALAEIHLYRALLGSFYADYKPAAFDLYDSYKVVTKSGSGFSISDFNKLSGIIGVLLKQIPDQYVKYLKAVGVKPSGLSGLNGLELYYRSALPGSAERIEGYLLMITALKEFGKEPEDAWTFIKKEGKLMLDNPLIRYQSALAALKAGDCEWALKLLDPKLNGNVQPAFPYWNYQLGRCKLYQNDPTATDYFEKFLANPGGDNYRHIATLMQGWSYLIHGQQNKANDCIIRVKNMQGASTEYDRQAVREVSSGLMPKPGFIQVRLQFDGGYYEKCMETCAKMIESHQFSTAEDGELYYRKARCEQRLGKQAQAIKSFLEVIGRADAIQSYIVPNAALQLGELYKKAGQIELARKYYRICLDQNNFGYRDGIDRQARLALKELDK